MTEWKSSDEVKWLKQWGTLIRGGPGVTSVQNGGHWPWPSGRQQGKLLRGVVSDRTFSRWGRACQHPKKRMGILGLPLLWHGLKEQSPVLSGERQWAQWATLWCEGTSVKDRATGAQGGMVGSPESTVVTGRSAWGEGETSGTLLRRPEPYQTHFLTSESLPVTSFPLTSASQLSPQSLFSFHSPAAEGSPSSHSIPHGPTSPQCCPYSHQWPPYPVVVFSLCFVGLLDHYLPLEVSWVSNWSMLQTQKT